MEISILDHSPVGAGQTPGDALRNTIDLARRAERLGYHRFWLAEHHALPSHASPAPEIMITRVAAETSTIRVGSGGVLLALYAPMKVAEIFRMLHALYPDRIDLGIGRSTGALELETRALGLDHLPSEEDFQAKLDDLIGFLHDDFPDDHPYRTIGLVPRSPGVAPVWLLGSSPPSAIMAGRNGLPYSYAHFIKPATTREAIAAYRAAFRPSERTPRPTVILGIGVYCADTEEQAQRLYASHRALRARLTRNVIAPLPTPEQAIAEVGAVAVPDTDNEWPHAVVGAPEQVRAQITGMCDALDVDAVAVMAFIHDHKARVRSYELLAEAMDVVP
jgi:luciferase family oxidoreductase group 1